MGRGSGEAAARRGLGMIFTNPPGNAGGFYIRVCDHVCDWDRLGFTRPGIEIIRVNRLGSGPGFSLSNV